MTISAADETSFRTRVREFLDAHATRRADAPDDDAESAELVDAAKRFQGALADAGLAGLTYPSEHGGQGLARRYVELYNEVSRDYHLPISPLTISHGMCLPVLNDFGTDAQKERHLARMIRADEIWCQMFSEPGAGSDVASLQTRAVRDGDEWVLNGQKVWTSGAQYCDYGLCVARTDPDLPKHQGISMFIVDMRAPGVDIRPLRQVNGASGFNEIFLSDVRIPAEWLVGDVNQGWNIAIAMLMYERVAIGAGGSGPMTGRRTPALIELARRAGRLDDPVVRDRLADVHIRETILGFVGMRIRDAVEAGRAPGPEGSVAKLASAEVGYRAAWLAIELAGPGGIAWDRDVDDGDDLANGAISVMGIGIAGGTNEVQRNIIGERVLGLPKEPAVDRDVPFKDLLVGTQTR